VLRYQNFSSGVCGQRSAIGFQLSVLSAKSAVGREDRSLNADS
jgi:hypothetical protein